MLNELKINEGIISKLAILIFRLGNHTYYKVKLPVLRHLLLLIYKILDLLIIKLLIGADIPATAKIGKGLILKHGAKCVVIHPNTVIGENATIFHQVTFGIKGPHLAGLAPKIGDNCYIGAGAKVLGPIQLGDFVTVGANSVVVTNYDSNSVIAGIPARQIQRESSR